MTIGEKIIAAIASAPLVQVEINGSRAEKFGSVIYVWSQSAAEQLEAVVEAHVRERVEAALEEENRRHDLPGGDE